MLSNDDSKDSNDEEVFFGPVSDKELEITKKMNYRKTENFNFNNGNLCKAVEIQKVHYLQSKEIATHLCSSLAGQVSPYDIEATKMAHYPLQPNIKEIDIGLYSDSNSSYLEETSSNAVFEPVPSASDSTNNRGLKETSQNVNILPSQLAIQDEITCSLNTSKTSNQNCLSVDLDDFIMANMEETSTNNTLSQSDKLTHKVFSENINDSLESESYKQLNRAKEIKLQLCGGTKASEEFRNPVEYTHIYVASVSNNHKVSETIDSFLQSPTERSYNNEMADMLSKSFEFQKQIGKYTPISDNVSNTTNISLSFIKNRKGSFNLDINQLKSDCQQNIPIFKNVIIKQNYFDTLDLIDISSECDDISEANYSYKKEIQEKEKCLTGNYSNLSISNGNDASQNYDLILSNSERISHLPSIFAESINTEMRSFETERVFNDTIEDVEILLKYGAEYFEGNKNSMGNKNEHLSEIPKTSLTGESIPRSKKESDSSISSDAFISPCESYGINENVSSKTAFAEYTTRELQEEGSPKSQEKKTNESLQKLNIEQYSNISNKEFTSSKRQSIPTDNLKSKDKTPIFKSMMSCVTPINQFDRLKPQSEVNILKKNTRSAMKLQTKYSFIPETKHACCKPLKYFKSPISSESQILPKKMRGLSIVSPVAQYLENNPPPSLITTVKPKSKIDPKTIEKDLSPLGLRTLKDNKTPSSAKSKFHFRREPLPSLYYQTSRTHILEKENRKPRREISTNNNLTSITKHIGRFKVPNYDEKNGNSSRFSQEDPLMEVSICEKKSAQHSYTLR